MKFSQNILKNEVGYAVKIRGYLIITTKRQLRALIL